MKEVMLSPQAYYHHSSVIKATSVPVIYDVLQRDLLHLKRLIINVHNFIPFPPFPEKHFLPVYDC